MDYSLALEIHKIGLMEVIKIQNSSSLSKLKMIDGMELAT